MSLFESLSLKTNVRHIMHQRYIQNLSKNKNVRKEHNLKPKSQMGAYYTLIIVWLDKKLLYHNQLKV